LLIFAKNWKDASARVYTQQQGKSAGRFEKKELPGP
jgi:hypothetical protein